MAETKTPEAASRERFVRETAEHQMTVLRDDGLYRHLRFKRSDGSSFYWFDILTWPGRLVICGDVGDYMFSRSQDMFTFFGDGGSSQGFDSERWGINPYYWGEKLRGASHGRDQARHYSEDVYKARVREWLKDVIEAEDLDVDATTSLRAAVAEELLDDGFGELADEGEARRRLRDFEHSGHEISDSWEWDLREWDWSYLWCCWAIVWGIDKYRAAVPTEVAA